MPVKFMVKLTKTGTSLTIVIPKPIIDGAGLEAGDMFELTDWFQSGDIRLHHEKLYDLNTFDKWWKPGYRGKKKK